ncbi:MAG: hypothetical protein ABSB35_32060 [Bryobacteraceae bacterium]|jgi:hypothetical protein
MKRFVSALSVFVAAAGISLVLVFGLRAHPGNSSTPVYEPATETTVHGTVVETPTHSRMGLQLRIETKDGAVDVCLGPSHFIAQRGFSFAPHDSIEVTGSRITKGGSPLLVAREVIKDGKTLTLRDHGIPLWSVRPR